MSDESKDQPDFYSDFSEDKEVVESFFPGNNPPEWMNAIAQEIQKALERKNPVTSLKQLLAFGVAINAFQNRKISRQLTTIRNLLVVLVATLWFAMSIAMGVGGK